MQYKIAWLSNSDAAAQTSPTDDLSSACEVVRVDGLIHLGRLLAGETIDCVVLDGCLPDVSRFDALDFLRGVDAAVRVVFAGADLTPMEAARLVRSGAFHCVGPQDGSEALSRCIEDACEERRIANRGKRASVVAEWSRLLVGDSRPMQEVFQTIQIIGARRCTVLINGETGTGKEMAARALHMASPRAHLPMVAVNCSALPENLLEAELFGHVKGAFTGAITHRVGRFEQAHNSTIFLDEIGEMPLELQAKLLRVLQEREIQRLGSSQTVKVDVRVIAATNSNLQEKMRKGAFREDLFYRLNVVPMRMPPLRERRSDIPQLVDHFVAKICLQEGIPVKRVTPEAKEQLRNLPWPGNVRQLENLVEMAVAMCGDRIHLSSFDFGLRNTTFTLPDDAPQTSIDHISIPAKFAAAVANFERSVLDNALAKTGGNKTAAAQMLGMKRTTLIMKLRGLQDSAPIAQSA